MSERNPLMQLHRAERERLRTLQKEGRAPSRRRKLGKCRAEHLVVDKNNSWAGTRQVLPIPEHCGMGDGCAGFTVRPGVPIERNPCFRKLGRSKGFIESQLTVDRIKIEH